MDEGPSTYKVTGVSGVEGPLVKLGVILCCLPMSLLCKPAVGFPGEKTLQRQHFPLLLGLDYRQKPEVWLVLTLLQTILTLPHLPVCVLALCGEGYAGDTCLSRPLS